MKYENVCLASVGYELPPNAVSSQELEDRLAPVYERLKLPHGRLELMSGIKERRFWGNGMTPSSAAAMAGKKALDISGVPKEEIKVLFHASVCRDFLEPATANVVHNALGLPADATVFDISNACLGVLNGMITLANMIELGQVRAGLIVSGEMGEALVDKTIETLNADESLTRKTIKPAFASLTIGSAAVAVVMAHSDLMDGLAKEKHRLIGGVVQNATEHSALCKSDGDMGFSAGAQPLMDTDAELLLNAGCDLAEKTWASFKKEIGWNEDGVNRVFTHQVGIAHRRKLYEAIGVDIEKDFSTVEFLGNTGSAALPVTLGIGIEKGLLKSGDNVALLGIGSGLNSIMLGIEW